MLNKISNLKLILGLVILGLVYLAVVYFDSPRSEELEKELVAIDTSMVTAITIADEETVNLTRKDQQWLVELKTGKQVKAVPSKVTSLLDQLMKISPDRLAAKDRDKWDDYHVDSTGTVLQVREGENTTLDLVIGQSGSTSYLRLADETEVYTSDRFDGLRNQATINHYRNNLFVELDTDSITSISFNYPADSSFQILSEGGKWKFGDGSLTDSTKTVNYLNKLNLKYNQNFAEQDGSSVGPQLAEIVIDSRHQPQVSIIAYTDAADSVIYQSSVNQEAYFNDESLGKDYFIDKAALMNLSE